jgi:CrcB protein
MREIVAIAIAGAAGTVGRLALSNWTCRLLGERFPYGTLVVNIVGCLLLGAAIEVGLLTNLIPPAWRIPITVGFLGAFTTYSTFSYETMRYVEEGGWPTALANVGATLVLCLGATWLGLTAARAVFGGP